MVNWMYACSIRRSLLLFCVTIAISHTSRADDKIDPGGPADSIWSRVTYIEDRDERCLTVQYGDSQQICFDDFRGLESTRVIADRFLEVIYSTMGGTGVNRTMMALLTLYHGRLQCAMLGVQRSIECPPSDSCNGTEKYLDPAWADTDSITFNYLLSTSVANCSLLVTRNELFISLCAPSTNFELNDTLHLQFDNEFGVFCNQVVTLTDMAMVSPENHRDTVVAFESLIVPAILQETLREEYFIHGFWCYRTREGQLVPRFGKDCRE